MTLLSLLLLFMTLHSCKHLRFDQCFHLLSLFISKNDQHVIKLNSLCEVLFIRIINPITPIRTYVTGARTRLEPEVAKLTEEEKGQFLDSFSNHSVLLEINSAGKDPIERVKKFMALNDDELDLVVKMQIVVAGSLKEGKNLQAMMPVGTGVCVCVCMCVSECVCL